MKKLTMYLGIFAAVSAFVVTALILRRVEPEPGEPVIAAPYIVEPVVRFAPGEDPGLFGRYEGPLEPFRVYIYGVFRGRRGEEITHMLSDAQIKELVALLAESETARMSNRAPSPALTAWTIYLSQNGDTRIFLGGTDYFHRGDSDTYRQFSIDNGDEIEAALERMTGLFY